MSSPFRLIQLSDPHVGANWGPAGAARRLAAAVDAIRAAGPAPDAVLVTGDIADHAADDEYAPARESLARLEAPVHVLAGNHDRRGPLRRHFGVPGAGDDPIRYTSDLGPLRLLALDSTIPGEDAGALGAEQLDWLDAELAAAPGRPAVVALHHAPVVTGRPEWDAFGLAAGDAAALGDVLARHAQVRRVLAGHLHRVMVGERGGRAVLVAPSTHVQATLDAGGAVEFSADEPTGYVLHTLADGDLVSHVEALPPGR